MGFDYKAYRETDYSGPREMLFEETPDCNHTKANGNSGRIPKCKQNFAVSQHESKQAGGDDRRIICRNLPHQASCKREEDDSSDGPKCISCRPAQHRNRSQTEKRIGKIHRSHQCSLKFQSLDWFRRNYSSFLLLEDLLDMTFVIRVTVLKQTPGAEVDDLETNFPRMRCALVRECPESGKSTAH